MPISQSAIEYVAFNKAENKSFFSPNIFAHSHVHIRLQNFSLTSFTVAYVRPHGTQRFCAPTHNEDDHRDRQEPSVYIRRHPSQNKRRGAKTRYSSVTKLRALTSNTALPFPGPSPNNNSRSRSAVLIDS